MRTLLRRALVAAFVPFALAPVAQGCGTENAIVGGRCAVGFDECGGACVDPNVDAKHCGRCDVVCPTGVPCVSGVCGGLDGSTDGGDASTDGGDGSLGDGSDDDGSSGDGSSGDGGECLPPFDTAEACGDCNTRCRNPNGACIFTDAGTYVCGPTCVAPTINCHGRCLDPRRDPYNCGACGKICPSLLCENSLCVGANPGDVVVYGHDYRDAVQNTAQVRLLTNAFFIPRSDPLRVLTYEQFADPISVLRVKGLVQNASLGRRITYTVAASDADLRAPDLVQKFDVVVVFDQERATAAQLGTIGTGWNAPLAAFAQRGGVVLALDGAAGQGGMPSLLTSAGLLDTAGHTALATGDAVAVVAPFDTVAQQVVSPYGVVARSASLQSNEPNGGFVTWVVRGGAAGDGDPVVVHKVVPTPP